MADFDPLYQWLGIPPCEQPPDHYRLLGIRRYENDPVVIDNAADRQTVHLKTFQNGPKSEYSQSLLNRVSAARICLLNLQTKNAYDDRLRRDEETLPAAVIDSSAGRRTWRKRRILSAIAWNAVLCILVVTLGIIASRGPAFRPEPTARRDSTIADNPPAAATDQSALSKPLAAPTPPVAIKQQQRRKKREPNTTPKRRRRPNNPNAAAIAKATGSPIKGPDLLEKKSATVQTKDNRPVAKLPVPSAAEQKRIARLMEEVYGFTEQKTELDKTVLADRLIQDALKSNTDADERFVFLQQAAELAAEGGDAAVMFRASESLGERFEFDPTGLQLRLLSSFLERAGSLKDMQTFWLACESQINAELADDQYAAALETAGVVCQAVQRLQNREFRRQALAWKKAIARVHKEYQEFRQAEEKLAAAPDDPEANLTVGCWHCFERGDYPKGIPFLAKCSDVDLARAAIWEIMTPPKTATDRAALADAWWDMIEKAKSNQGLFFRLRAVHWYRQAQPGLTGMAKATAQKRIATVAGLASFAQPQNRLACLLEQNDANILAAKINNKLSPIKWTACVWCDDAFVMCVNGKEVLQGNSHKRFFKKMLDVAEGDIITVRVFNRGGPRCFCCAMQSQKGHLLISGPAWQSYLPTSETAWSNPNNICVTAPVLPGNAGLDKKFLQNTGVKVQGIWGEADTSYLTTQVP